MQNPNKTPDWLYGNIKDAAGQAEKVYYIYLGAILFVLISLSTIPDKALYLENFPLKLPVIQSEVPAEIFVWFAPLLLIFIYIGLQVSLYKVVELSRQVEVEPPYNKENRIFPFSLYNSLVYPEGGVFGTIQTFFAELSTFYSIVFVCLKAFCVTLKGREIFKESAVFAITCFAFILAIYYQRRFREASNSRNKVEYTSKINAFIWGLIAFGPSFIWLLNEDEYIASDWFLYSSLFVWACISGLIGYVSYKCFRKRKLITRKCFYCSKFSFICFFIAIGFWLGSLRLLTDRELLFYQDWYPTNLFIENIKAEDKFKYGGIINWKGATLINIDMPYFGQKFGGQIILDHAIIYDQLRGDFTGASLKYADISETSITNLKVDDSTDLTYANLKKAKTQTSKEEKKDDKDKSFNINYRADNPYWLSRIVNGINLSEAELEGENKFKGTIFVNSDLRSLLSDDFCQAYSLWNTEIDQKKLSQIKDACPKVLQPMNLDFFIEQHCKNGKDEKNKQDDKLCAEKKYSQYFEDIYGINQKTIDDKQIKLIKTQIQNKKKNYFRGASFGELNLEGIVLTNSDLTFTDFSKAKNITCEKIGFFYKLDQIFTSLFDKKPKPANLCEALSLYGSKSNCSAVCPKKYEFPSCELALNVGDDFILVKDLIEERNLSGLPFNVTKEKPEYDKCSIADYDYYFSNIKENICSAESLKNTQLSKELKEFVKNYCPDKLK